MSRNRYRPPRNWRRRYAEIMDKARTKGGFNLRTGIFYLCLSSGLYSFLALYALVLKLQGKPWDYLIYGYEGTYFSYATKHPTFTHPIFLYERFWQGVCGFAFSLLCLLLYFADIIDWQSLLVRLRIQKRGGDYHAK